MGSCEDSLQVHEPVHQAAIEQHLCLDVIHRDNASFPDFIGSNVDPSSSRDACIELYQKDDTGFVSCGYVMEAASVDRRIGVVCEGENVAGLVAGKFSEDDCRVRRACRNQWPTGIDDSNVETDGSCVEKVGSGGENDELVNLLEKCDKSLELMSVSTSLRNCNPPEDWKDDENENIRGIEEGNSDGLAAIEMVTCEETVSSPGGQMPENFDQLDNHKHDNNGGAQVVMEEKSDDLTYIGTDTHEKIVPLAGCGLPTAFSSVNLCRNSDNQDERKNDESGSVQGVVEEKDVSLAITESDTCGQIVLSADWEMPAGSIPVDGLPRNCGCQDYQKDEKNVCVQEIQEEKGDSIGKRESDTSDENLLPVGCKLPVELTPVNGFSKNSDQHTDQEQEEEEEEEIGSGQVVMEEKRDSLAASETDSCSKMVASAHCEMPAELIPVNGSPRICLDQDKQKDVGTSLKVVMVQNQMIPSLGSEKSLEIVPTEINVLQDGQKHDHLVSSCPGDGAVEVKEMKNDPLARVGTLMNNQVLSSLDGEMQSVPFSGLLRACPLQNEPTTSSTCGSAIERDLDGKIYALHGVEADICNKKVPHSDEMPIKLENTGDLVNGCDWQIDQKNGKDVNCPSVEKIPKDSGIDRCIQVLPMQACLKTLENLTITGFLSNCAQQNELRCDMNADGSFMENTLEVVEETSDIRTDVKVDICSQMLCKEGNAIDMKEGLLEIGSNCFAVNSALPQSCELIGVEENVSCKRLGVSYPSGEDVFGSDAVDCSGHKVMDHLRIDCVSETKFNEIVSSSSQKSSGLCKSNRKTWTKIAARRCRNTAKVQEPHAIVEIAFKAVRRKRSCFSKPARSSIWGLLGNITQTFKLSNGLELDGNKSHGTKKARIGQGSGRRNNSRSGGSSRRSSGKRHSSTSCIRLKIKVGKDVASSGANIMVPVVIDTLGSADVVIGDYGNQSYLGNSFEIANLAHGVEDKVGEEGTVKDLECFDNKLEKTKTYSDASVVDVQLANKDLEGTVISEKSGGDATGDYLGCHVEVEELGVTIGKRYTDPGTSPDSEVINLAPEAQVGARCQEDFSDVILTSSKTSAALRVTDGKKEKKKDRLSHTGNCFVEDRSPNAGIITKVKPTKKRGGKQREGDGMYSSETHASSTIAIASSNSSNKKEFSMDLLPLSRETELRDSKEAMKVEISKEAEVSCSLDVGLQLSESQISKELLVSTKSKAHRLLRKSDGVSMGRSKVSNSARSRKANGCRKRGNERKSLSKKKVKDKSVCDHIVCKAKDDPKTGNHIADDSGKTSTGSIGSVDVANLDITSSGLMEQYLSMDNAWVRCDDCYKWRRIPVALVESIGQTNCQWICKDNTDTAFADCCIPQEKSNAEINVELGISDADEDACDVPSNNRGSEFRHTSVSNEYEFMRITTNQFLHRSRKTQTIDEIMVCHCKAPLNGGLGCGDECLNRMLNIECVQGTCPCGDLCSNQQFQRRNYAKMKWERCGKKGFGLQCEENISKGQFLIEYVGEVLDVHTYEARQKEYASKGHKHFYFMTLDGSEVIDACAKGNLGRFINHSCDPNCRTEKWVVNGEICIGLFALRDIKKAEEVTFDYNYVRVVGAAAKKCYCGSPQCRGYIGGDPTNTEVINQVDSDEEFPEPIMLEDGEARDSIKTTIPRPSCYDGIEISKDSDKIESFSSPFGRVEVAADIEDSMNQSASSISQSRSAIEMNDITENIIEETMSKSSFSIQGLETPPSTILSKSSSDGIGAVRQSKSSPAEDKRVFVKSRFFIKTSRQSGCFKKGKSTSNLTTKVQMTANKPQVLSLKPKKLIEGTSNGRFEAVQEKLNELLDAEGGISKRKDAPKGYLKLLLLTAASGASGNGEAIQSNRDLSMILDALLKTKSRAVMTDIINKNGLRMLHNIMKQYRRDFKKIPILRKLLKVLEYLAVREILTLEHISRAPPCPGMESFTESILSLTEHDDKQVHQIARNFRDRWIPRHVRKHSYMDRDDGRVECQRSSNSNRVSASHNHWPDQEVRHAEAVEFAMQSKLATISVDAAVHGGTAAPCIGSSTRTRKRQSRWDQPAKEKPDSRSLQQKIESGLPPQPESNTLPDIGKESLGHADKVSREYSYCPDCAQNYYQQDGASSADAGRLNIHEDVPPGFSSPINPALVSCNASSTITDVPQQNVSHLKFPVGGPVGLPQKKFVSHLPVSYGIPLPIVEQFGSTQAETVEGWVVSPGMPFRPFPPLPPFPRHKKETPTCAVDSMVTDEIAEQPDSHDTAACPHESNPRMNGANQSDMDIPDADDHQTFKRARGSSYDLGRRYFRQQKWNKVPPPWVRNRNGWGYIGDNSRGGMRTTDIGTVTNDHRNSYCSQDLSCRVEKAGNLH